MAAETSDRLSFALQASLGGPRRTLLPLNASTFCTTWRAEGGGPALFVKSLPIDRADVLEAEADGLAALAATRTVRVPEVAACRRDDALGVAVLALEWLDFAAPGAEAGERLGEALGALHRAEPPGGGRYGWHRDNFLGATPQRNRFSSAADAAADTAVWCDFFARERLRAMAERLASRNAPVALLAAVDAAARALPEAFAADGHAARPSLIHGDLWSGNHGVLADGTPVLFDPAVSCADAEAELAMLELFGAPPAGFWPAYRDAAGLSAGYQRRRGFYQLYHLLNHALLFGGGYLRQSHDLASALVTRR